MLEVTLDVKFYANCPSAGRGGYWLFSEFLGRDAFCNRHQNALRLVFTSDGVGVGVVTRSVKRYDLVKIKQRSCKQSFLLRLRFRRLRSSENQFVGVVSRSEELNQS